MDLLLQIFSGMVNSVDPDQTAPFRMAYSVDPDEMAQQSFRNTGCSLS